jgi:[NiFe] hydrogenase diaphorase moiety small subunit
VTKPDKTFTICIDGETIPALGGQTIMDACDKAGIYIPRLCDVEGLVPQGSCRVCTIKVNGMTTAACTQPAEPDLQVEHQTSELQKYRRDLVLMLFNEGNHLCPICEASGRCELQAMAYRLGISQATKYPYLQPARPVDASHPDIALDNNRCILCGRCIRASRDVDGKNVFEYVGRGINKRIGVNGDNLAATDATKDDYAMSLEVCPVGCIIRKQEGFFAPYGEREFDQHPIGYEIESRHIPLTDADLPEKEPSK